MFVFDRTGLIKIILFVSILFLPTIGIGTIRAEDKIKTDTQHEIMSVITAKDGGYIRTTDRVFLLIESTKLYDVNGGSISLYQIPLPVKANIVYKNIPDSYPHVLKITIQEDLTSHNQPE